MTPPLRVLHLVDSLNLGGIQTWLRDMLPGLAKRGVDVRLAAIHGPGPFTEILAERGIAPIHLGASKWNIALPGRLSALLRDSPVDVLHTHGVPSCWLGQRAFDRQHVPTLLQHVHHLYQGQHGQPLQNQLERLVYHRGSALVTCSYAVADSVPCGLPKHVIYNGVDTAYLVPPTITQRNEARARFGFAPTDFVVCMVGRVTRDKGVHFVCEGLAKMVSKLPQLKLFLVGSGPDEGRVRDYCRAMNIEDHVIFAGFQSEVRPCFYASDASVMASEKEGLNLAMIEALAAGLPTLVVDSPATREAVVDGVSARVFYRDDPESLVAALREVMTDGVRRSQLGEAGRARVVECFSLEDSIDALVGLYGDLTPS